MPPNYREQQGLPLQSHERKGALVLAAAVLLIAAGVGVWEAADGGAARPTGKCVAVSVGSSTGGGTLRQCGTSARTWCASEAKATGSLASQIQAACRREGFLATSAGAK